MRMWTARCLGLLLCLMLSGCGLHRQSVEPTAPTPIAPPTDSPPRRNPDLAGSDLERPTRATRPTSRPLSEPRPATDPGAVPPRRGATPAVGAASASGAAGAASASSTSSTSTGDQAVAGSQTATSVVKGADLPPTPPALPSAPVAPVPLEPIPLTRSEPDTSLLIDMLRAYSQGQPEEATKLLAQFEPTEREMLRAVLPVIAKVNARRKTDPRELEELARRLQSMLTDPPPATLSVPKVTLCRRVRRFADFDPLPSDYRLRPGEMIEVYFEVRNFTTTCPGPGQPHTVRLAYTLEVVDASGTLRWSGPLEPIDDHSLSPRHDFFQSIIFKVPDLPTGEYRMIVQVTDCQSGQNTRQSVALNVQAGSRGRVGPSDAANRATGG